MMWYRDTPFALGGTRRAHLKVAGPERRLRRLPGAARPAARGQARADRDPRPQRRRQDHAAEGARRPDPAQRRGRCSTAKICPSKTHEIVAARHGAGGRRPAAVPADDGAPRTWSSAAGWSPKAERARRLRTGLRRLPQAARARPAARRHDERRRAADGGGGARDDERAAPADARRALARPGAEDGRRAARDRAAHRRRRHHRADGRAERASKALAVADRGYVLERGTLVASGPAALLARSTVIREAYLGAEQSDTTTRPTDAAARSPPRRTSADL